MGRHKTLFELDLVRIAKWHKRCFVLALVLLMSLILYFVLMANARYIAPGGADILIIALQLAHILSLITAVVFVIMLQHACGRGVFTIALWAFITLILSVVAVASAVSSAGAILRLAGAKPGFAGFPKGEIDKLRDGHCRGCGYSRDGIGLLDPCPECERVPVVV